MLFKFIVVSCVFVLSVLVILVILLYVPAACWLRVMYSYGVILFILLSIQLLAVKSCQLHLVILLVYLLQLCIVIVSYHIMLCWLRTNGVNTSAHDSIAYHILA